MLLLSKGREREQQYFSPEKGLFLNMATLSNIMAAADDILERSIFLVLKHLLEIYVEKYRATTYFSGKLLTSHDCQLFKAMTSF